MAAGEPQLRTFLTWQSADPAVMADAAVVVVDVLRWSTVAITALANGATAVECFQSPEAVIERRRLLPPGAALAAGERGGRRITGFDLGNSPLEYGAERVAGRRILSTTTNGTRALGVCLSAREVVVGAFVNLTAVVGVLARYHADGSSIVLLGAGQEGSPTLEDTICCGVIASRMTIPSSSDHGTQTALAEWVSASRDLALRVRQSQHAGTLERLGFGADLDAALALDRFGVVPRLASRTSVTSDAPTLVTARVRTGTELP